ncbi:MAG: agmatine deiminase family protein [Candidatus Neomarinimicrobiota bacterium]|jgi:agmatine/peptidylarginine deiminase
MRKLVFIVGFFSLIYWNLYAQGIPAFWYKSPQDFLTKEQLDLIDQFKKSSQSLDQSTPPPFIPRTMAEWEENQGLLLSWGNDSYSNEQRDVLCEVIYHVLQEDDLNIFLVCIDSISVKQYLDNNHDIQSPRIKYLIEPSLIGIWARDFGPMTIYENIIENYSLMDWKYAGREPGDGEVPQLLADFFSIPRYENNGDSDFSGEFEGGNFTCDGHSTASSTDEYDNTFEIFNGITSSRWLHVDPLPFPYPNYNTDHIDIFMKLLDEETILVGRFKQGDYDYGLNDDIDADIAKIQIYYETHFGRQFKIHTIPMPSPTQHNWGYGNGWVFRSYTNSLIINKLVLVPTYNHARDAEAVSTYQTLMPGYNIVPINCTALNGLAGAIHCVTMGIGASSPIYIEHAKIRADEANEDIDHTGPYEIRALMKSQTTISGASLYWSNSPGSGYQQLPLVDYGSDSYLAYIPPQAPGNTVYYYLSATNAEKTITKPIPADEGAYIGFQVDAGAEPPDNLSFSNEEVKSGIEVEFQASNCITAGSNYVVKNGADVSFTAGNSITLNGGTTIELGASFHADVDPNFIGGLAKRAVIAGGSTNNAENTEQRGKDAPPYQENIPLQFSLSQNFPNPFNPTTTIQYTLKEECYVNLKIYNISGQEVRTLVNEYQPAGYKSTMWDGRNSLGQQVPSGIYLYKIKAADFTEYKKMAMVK